ncbi:thioredoxin domain-containing protein [Maricaulis alexandrii]|uniref:thioredoxin domain-containing protein n=1 Tax=Maricaulis alexandrii TaxID=2570354 RepID=UPI0011098229|nr:thioredoxin domain-containing protein [Maricaulis alexandrii]
MKFTRRVFSAVAVSAALMVGACGGGGDGAPSAGQGNYERAGDRGLGNPDAPVTIIEYASVACGACAQFHNTVYPTLEEYIEAGQLRFVLREMITGSPQFAIAGFSLAHCVPEDQYFDMVDLLFQQQGAIFQAAQTRGSARNQYLAIARSMGLSEDEFVACLNNEEINQSIVDAHDRAADDGITGTPQFLINGELLEANRAPGASEYTFFLGTRQVMIDGEPVPAMMDAETFSAIIDHLIAEADGAAEADGE